MLGSRSVVVVVLACTLLPAAAAGAASVDTRIGTQEGAPDFGTGGGAGATYPGAVAPFGMVQLSPDTAPGIDNPAGGYSYVDHQIKGFSLTHLSGAGCAGLSDVPLLPTTHTIDTAPSLKGSYDVNPRYVANYTHKGEVARPGDYRVTLNPGRSAIRTELTARSRAGALRATFPATARRASIVVNAGGSAMGNTLSDLRVDARRREISGTVASGGFCYARDRYTLHFVVRFDRAFAASGTWKGATLHRGARSVHDAVADRPGPLLLQYKRIGGGPKAVKGNPTKGTQAGAYATFALGHARAVTAKVAISLVSVDGARRNLAADGTRSFAAMRAAAVRTWAQRLGRLRVSGGAAADRTMFDTSLYHAQVMPNVVSDADGRYMGEDGRVHRAAGFSKYSNISGWDTYRSQLPLMAMVAPREASDLVRSLVADQQDGGSLPKWSALSGQTNVMVGDPADLLIAGAYAFGARGFDKVAALRAMVAGATQPKVIANGGYVERAGLADYLRLGYVGHEQNTDSPGQTVTPSRVWGTAATTLEYALADFGIARLAAAAGDGATCSTFATRAGNWRNVFDPVTGLMQPRDAATGAFVPVGATGGDGFVEGTAAQYTWFVPQDVAGLTAALGGADAARARLDRFFTELNAGAASDHAFLGNEPTLLTPLLYDWLGRPAAGAGIVRKALLGLYHPAPGGFPGNDDGGQMSAWYVLGALGLSPAVPGTGVLALSGPLFPHATLTLAGGRTVELTAPQAARGNPYINAVTVDGKPYNSTWLAFDRLTQSKHTRIAFTLSGSAAQSWGTGAQSPPPSYGGAAACQAAGA